MRRDGFELELRGGPLAGRSARVTDTEMRIAVVQEGGRLRMRDERTLADDAIESGDAARLIGAYGFSHREEALVWFPALRRAP